MDMCICGHSEREHDPTGECRAAGCRCRHFKPEIRRSRVPHLDELTRKMSRSLYGVARPTARPSRSRTREVS
jgi:hypothetical protein